MSDAPKKVKTAKKKRRRRRTKAPSKMEWGLAEIAYVNTPGLTHKEIAERLNVSGVSVARYSKTHNWTSKRALREQELLKELQNALSKRDMQDMQKAVEHVVSAQTKCAELVNVYPDMLKAALAEWWDQYKAAKAAKPPQPVPKAPISVHEFKAIAEFMKTSLGWERLRQGEPSDIQGHATLVGLIGLLTNESDALDE